MKSKMWLLAMFTALTLAATIAFVAATHRGSPGNEADQRFIHTLDVAHIDYPDEDAAVAAARGICALLDRGIPLINVVMGEVAAGAANTLPRANYLVISAALAYCPEYVVPREPIGQVV
jgi:hypothetical protein